MEDVAALAKESACRKLQVGEAGTGASCQPAASMLCRGGAAVGDVNWCLFVLRVFFSVKCS